MTHCIASTLAALVIGLSCMAEPQTPTAQETNLSPRARLPEDHPDSIQTCYDNWDAGEKEYLFALCEERDLDPTIMAAVIYNESNFVPDAIGYNTNGTRDWGYCQINDVCFDFISQEMDIDSMEDLLDPYLNLEAAANLMAYHKEATGDDAAALLRYQVGEGAYRRMIDRGETSTPTLERVLFFSNLIQ